MKYLLIALLLGSVILILCGTLAACTGAKPSGPAGTIPPASPVEYKDTEIPNGKTVATAARYANTVNGYYTVPNQDRYVAENLNARLTYNLSGRGTGFVGLESLTDPEGHPYVTNTMDVFIKTADGSVLYASSCAARANLYDQGYYYYNLHILDQTFSDNGNYSYKKSTSLPLTDCNIINDVGTPSYGSDGSLSFTVESTYDPYISFRLKDKTYAVEEYSGFLITMKSSYTTSADIFYIAGDNTSYTANERLGFKLNSDGEYHSYYVPFDTNVNFKGFLKGVRIDAGDTTGETIYIRDVSVVDIDLDSFPPVKIDRNYNVYSDKINESVRLVAIEPYGGALSYGTVTVIPKSTVRAFVVNDKNGPHYSMEEIDWDSAAYAGFDVENAGVFGIILGADEAYAGTLKVDETDSDYIITRELSMEGKKLKKGGEIFMANRIYTDCSHDFRAFLQEAYCERFPLEVEIEEEGSTKKAKFTGYDDLTGAYMLTLNGAGDFNQGYEKPLEEHRVRFTVRGDSSARNIYVRGNITTDGCIECGVVLDENDMLLPVKVEVCKNFANDGEELFYTKNDSISYGLGIFPVTAVPSENTTLTFAALYEQWGNYRLKQVSSIRFHTAYYHMSLGVTETNCINLYSTSGRLPDHRGLSTVYWADEKVDVLDSSGAKTGRTKMYNHQPQHANVGSHIFLQYTDSDGNFNSYINQGRTVISSSGPTYQDVTLTYLSKDGKVLQTYRHLEMPQTDENRTYCEITYEFLGDVTVNNVYTDFCLYRCDAKYEKFGYLDENNNEVITDALKDQIKIYKLGSDHPYFDSFRKVTINPGAYVESDVSCNVSFLLDQCEATIGGKKYTGGFVVAEGLNSAAFTFDIKGKVTFRKGDVIKLSCILMPWGSFFSEDDSNVRMVRRNTLQNPITITPDGCAEGGDRILPTVISKDGEKASFTISGGYANVRDLPGYATSEYTIYKVSWERDYNVTVKVRGIKKLGVPTITEKFPDGSEAPYNIASSLGYDGYMVDYEPDGTFSYTFVVTMTDAVPRTFSFTV